MELVDALIIAWIATYLGIVGHALWSWCRARREWEQSKPCVPR